MQGLNEYPYRHAIGLCIILMQILLATRYYTWLNDDPMNERFAWRMLSEVSMAKREITWDATTIVGEYNATLHIPSNKWFSPIWERCILFGDWIILDNAANYICEKETVDYVKYHFKATFLDGNYHVKTRVYKCN